MLRRHARTIVTTFNSSSDGSSVFTNATKCSCFIHDRMLRRSSLWPGFVIASTYSHDVRATTEWSKSGMPSECAASICAPTTALSSPSSLSS